MNREKDDFIIDDQTINDLYIFHRNESDSIFGLFNKTKTKGGEKLLRSLFQQPLSDIQKIEERINLFRFFCQNEIEFPFDREYVDIVNDYLFEEIEWIVPQLNTPSNEKCHSLPIDHHASREGVLYTVRLLKAVGDFIEKITPKAKGSCFERGVKEMEKLLFDERISWALKEKGERTYKRDKTIELSSKLRFEAQELFQQFFPWIFWLDVYIAVAETVKEKKLVFPKPLPKENNKIDIKGVYHPRVNNAVTNDIFVDKQHQILFLTGANMAGKSTFMKSFGIALYLAHMGFPVAAKEMTFSIRDGLLTTINLPDKIKEGYSHFYAEVMRIKMTAEMLPMYPYLVVISDELFRGTNVKDAYDGTLAVIKAYAKGKQTLLFVSTHITEVGEELKDQLENIQFIYLPSTVQEDRFVFSYKLKKGITEERLGMYIVNKERIVEIIQGKENVEKSSPQKIENQLHIDSQTINDLDLFHPLKKSCIFNLFNRTVTEGGEQHLRLLFLNPRSNIMEINQRKELFKYFFKTKKQFPFKNDLIKNGETYWNFSTPRFKPFAFTLTLWWRIVKFFSKFLADRFPYYFSINPKFDFIKEGIWHTIRIINLLDNYYATFKEDDIYKPQINEFQQIIKKRTLSWTLKYRTVQRFSCFRIAWLDYLIRGSSSQEIQRLSYLLHELDALCAVAEVAHDKNLVWAEPDESGNEFYIKNLFHPEIENPVTNSIYMNQQKNMFFLTGANMAGKSTFMKSVGISTYLAHAGFPVPASEMTFPVMHGMYSSINISDKVNLGYSHFFSEVLRIKKIAEELNRGKKLMIIMDELFKGTNVKDVFDATLAVTNAFAKIRGSLFIISTHVIETADLLKQQHKNILFHYFPAGLENGKPVFPYTLTDGITSDRYGMVIIRNEQIIETIEKGCKISAHISTPKT